jgi:hypothetical protein
MEDGGDGLHEDRHEHGTRCVLHFAWMLDVNADCHPDARPVTYYPLRSLKCRARRRAGASMTFHPLCAGATMCRCRRPPAEQILRRSRCHNGTHIPIHPCSPHRMPRPRALRVSRHPSRMDPQCPTLPRPGIRALLSSCALPRPARIDRRAPFLRLPSPSRRPVDLTRRMRRRLGPPRACGESARYADTRATRRDGEHRPRGGGC